VEHHLYKIRVSGKVQPASEINFSFSFKRGGVNHPLILLIFAPEKDKDPPLMALLSAMGPYIVRTLAQRMRFKG